MKRILAIFALLMLTACTTVSPDQKSLCGLRPTEEQAKNAVQVYINQGGLKDPSSAQIRNIRIENPTRYYKGLINGGGYNYGWQIAFEYNAKNSFGGYVGYKVKRILRTPNGMIYWNFSAE